MRCFHWLKCSNKCENYSIRDKLFWLHALIWTNLNLISPSSVLIKHKKLLCRKIKQQDERIIKLGRKNKLTLDPQFNMTSVVSLIKKTSHKLLQRKSSIIFELNSASMRLKFPQTGSKYQAVCLGGKDFIFLLQQRLELQGQYDYNHLIIL